MEKTEEKVEKLKVFVEGGRERFDRDHDLPLEYVTGIVVPALKDVLEGLCLQIEKRHRLDEAENEKGHFVIHYTSIAALVSMLQNAPTSTLRLYDSIHFNDPDEGNYFVRHLILLKKYDWLNKKNLPHAYITSFIIPDAKNEKDMSDNLVFWRTYGKEGEGCSLSLPIPRDQLKKVLYGSDKVKHTAGLLSPVLDSLDPLVQISKHPLGKDVQEKLAEVVWKSLEGIRYLYKSEAYEYEKECRFVIPESDADKDKICFEDQGQNNSPARIRHYYEDDALKTNNILITGSSITLGPCVPYPYNIRYYLESLMRKAGLSGPEIRFSKIPYRKS